MALLELDRRPSHRDLLRFGAALPLALSALGGVLFWRASTPTYAFVLWGAAAVLALAFFSVRPFRRPIYLVWTTIVFPVGWVLSHAVLFFAYYAVITPIGLARRALGSDPLSRRFERDRPSYWVRRTEEKDPSTYFRQF